MSASILVVEDDRLTREAVREGLSRSGYTVLEASTIATAKVLLADHHVDVVLCDVGLPDGEGTLLADHVHMRSPATPVVLMTGRLDPPDREHVLCKPIRLADLLEKVAALVKLAPPPTQRSVLIVDDDDVARQLLHARLERDGYRVLVAEDGGQAVQVALQARPDAIVSDVVMPGLDGFELCAALRAREELDEIPIILLTALDVRAPDRSLARAVGASALVRRSPGLEELQLTLASLPSLDIPSARPREERPHEQQLRDQLHAELQRRQAQEHAGALLAGRLAAVASVSEIIARGGRLPVLDDTLERLLDAPHVEFVALWTEGPGGLIELEAMATVRGLDRAEVASFFGRGDLISFDSDDVMITVSAPEVLKQAAVSGVALVPLVHRHRPLGVVAFGFSGTFAAPPTAFLRACQVVLTLELIILKSEEITDVRLIFEDSIDEPSFIDNLGEAPLTEEVEE